MNKRDVIHTIASETGISVSAAEAALDSALACVGRALSVGEKVVLPGFGTFEPRARAERSGRNPQTGEPLTVPAATVPAFRPAGALKQLVADSATATR